MDVAPTTVLVAIGFFGGLWNGIAGGATLFTFPALMAVGLPPIVANATNYLALLPSNAAAIPAYTQELRGLGRELVPPLVLSGLGAVFGSVLLLISNSDIFVALLPFLILFATGLFAFGDVLRAWLLKSLGAVTCPLQSRQHREGGGERRGRFGHASIRQQLSGPLD